MMQEQAEDILVPQLLLNCLTLNRISYSSYFHLPVFLLNDGPCNSFNCLAGHFKHVYHDDDGDYVSGLISQKRSPIHYL